MSEFKLFEAVINLSLGNSWEECKKEWDLIGIEKSKNAEVCLCGHFPIKELCHFKNNINQSNIIVGNCCVNKFFEDVKTNKMFLALSKNKLNKEIINLALDKMIIIPTEHTFLINVWRKRKLTKKQSDWYLNLKKRIKEAFDNGRFK